MMNISLMRNYFRHVSFESRFSFGTRRGPIFCRYVRVLPMYVCCAYSTTCCLFVHRTNTPFIRFLFIGSARMEWVYFLFSFFFSQGVGIARMLHLYLYKIPHSRILLRHKNATVKIRIAPAGMHIDLCGVHVHGWQADIQQMISLQTSGNSAINGIRREKWAISL